MNARRNLVPTNRRNRRKGFTVCRRCRDVVFNDQLVELVRPGRERGTWYCPGCAAELTGGTDVRPNPDP